MVTNVLANLRAGKTGPEEMARARQAMAAIASQPEQRGELLELARYVLSVQPETYDEVLAQMRRNPEQARLSEQIDSWGSQLDPKNRRYLMQFLMAAEPAQAETAAGRLELLNTGLFCSLPETHHVLGAHVAHELVSLELPAGELMTRAQQRLAMNAALGGAPIVFSTLLERVESPVLRARLAPLAEQLEGSELLQAARQTIADFETCEVLPRALMDQPGHATVREHEGMLVVGPTVLRKRT